MQQEISNSTPYYLGIDGGGTKTAAVILDADRNEIWRGAAGTINLNGAGADVVQENLRSLIAAALQAVHNSEPIAGSDSKASADATAEATACPLHVVLAGAGISNPAAAALLSDTLSSCGISSDRFRLVGDDEAAMAGALSGEDGIILISGTGSICRAIMQEKSWRSGGYGYLIDDEGSGYSIGREILTAVIRSLDGRSQRTALTQAVADRLTKLGFLETRYQDAFREFRKSGISASNNNTLSFEEASYALQSAIVSYVYRQPFAKADIASFASLLSEELITKDAAAARIAETAAQQLLQLVQGVYTQLTEDIASCHTDTSLSQADQTSAALKLPVCLMGSVLTKNRNIAAMVEAGIRKDFPLLQPVSIQHDAAFGAALIAINYVIFSHIHN